MHCQWLRLEFDLVQSYLEMSTLAFWKILVVVVNPTEGSGEHEAVSLQWLQDNVCLIRNPFYFSTPTLPDSLLFSFAHQIP